MPHLMHRRTALLALLALLALPVLACGGGDDPTAPPTAQSIVGAYTLRDVNGAGVPSTLIQDRTGRVEVLAATLTFNADGSFSDAGTLRFTHPNGTVETRSSTTVGRYTLAGNAVTMVDAADGERSTAVYTNGVVTWTIEPFVLVYRR